MRDIASKSIAPANPGPIVACSRSAATPRTDFSTSACRIADSFRMSRCRRWRNCADFADCAASQTWRSSRGGSAASQSASSPSTFTAARSRRWLSSKLASPCAEMRAAALSHSVGQTTGSARGDERTDLLLQPQAMLADALGVGALRYLLEGLVEQA